MESQIVIFVILVLFVIFVFIVSAEFRKCKHIFMKFDCIFLYMLSQAVRRIAVNKAFFYFTASSAKFRLAF